MENDGLPEKIIPDFENKVAGIDDLTIDNQTAFRIK